MRARGKVPLHEWIALGVIVLLAQAVKRTTLIVLPLVVWLLVLPDDAPLRRRWRPFALFICGLILTLLLFPSVPQQAAEWERNRERSPAWRLPGQGIDGSAAFFIQDHSHQRRLYIAQNLLADDVPHVWGQMVIASARVRGIQSKPWVCLSVIDRVAQSAACTQAGENWDTLRVQHRVYAGTPFVRVVVGIGTPRNWGATGEALVDDVTLARVGHSENLLRNGSAEVPRSRLRVLAHKLLRTFHLAPSAMYVPKRWSHPLPYRLGLAVVILFASFWGDFGWLQYPLPVGLYVALAMVTLIASIGVINAFRHAKPNERSLLAFDVASVLLAFFGSLVPVVGSDWMPQGRYLFPVLLPIVALGVQGLDAWCPPSWHPSRWMRVWIGLTALFSLFAPVWVLLTMRYGILI